MSLHNKRRGNAAIFALTLVPLLGFGALSVDIGLQRMTITQVQAAAEAGATAGAAYLNGTQEGLYAAKARAAAIAELNYVYGDFDVTDADVKLRTYDQATGTFTVLDADPATVDPSTINAVFVDPDLGVDSVLSRFVFGVHTLNAAGEAAALIERGGVAKYVDCYLPFALPSCVFQGWRNLGGVGNPSPRYLANDQTDTLAWGLPDNYPLNPTPAEVQKQLSNACQGSTAATSNTGDCDIWDPNTTEGCASSDCTDCGEEMDMNNGVGATTFRYIGDLITGAEPSETVGPWPTTLETPLDLPDKNDFSASTDANGNIVDYPEAIRPNATLVDRTPGNWGNSVQGVVPIIEHLGCTVDQTSGAVTTSSALNQSAPIIGWTYAYLYDISDGAPRLVGNGNEKPFLIQFDFVNDYDIGYGQCEGENCTGNVSGSYPPSGIATW